MNSIYLSPPITFYCSFDRVVAKISKIEDEAGINLPAGDAEISKVSTKCDFTDLQADLHLMRITVTVLSGGLRSRREALITIILATILLPFAALFFLGYANHLYREREVERSPQQCAQHRQRGIAGGICCTHR